VIKVAFWYDRPLEYSGGLNYFRNLVYALSRMEDAGIQPYVFFGTHVDGATIREFSQFATVVTTPLLHRRTLPWVIHRVLFEYLGSLYLINRLVRKHGIEIVSHGEHVYGKVRPFRVVYWIPDFQYLHLPELFPASFFARQTRLIRAVAEQADAVVLSSHAAHEDFRQIVGDDLASRVTVLPFVSQPTLTAVEEPAEARRSRLKDRYGVTGRFFYLPNQFWKHKNHAVVLEAVRLAKDRGVELRVVCTGNLKDYRTGDETYADQVSSYIASNRLQGQISVLGSIEYSDVLRLMEESIGLINPSRFEGWSSTVEEAKSLGKCIILSDIPVHREQAPARAAYFQPDDAAELARILIEHWNSPTDLDVQLERRRAKETLARRTLEFARGYADVIRNLLPGR
jgi:glycosyltransferase involved in cell wall biosynthesis